MKRFLPLPALILAVALTALLCGQAPQQPAPQQPDPIVQKEIAPRVALLYKKIESLRKQGVRDPYLSDLEIYHRAAALVVTLNEFNNKDSVRWTLDALDRGMLRANQAAQGETPWVHFRGQSVIRSYRSRVDGTVQPFAVTLPPQYGRDPKKRWRLDVVLHGRDNGLNEVKFLYQHRGDAPASQDQAFVRLDVFGRGNNAYRWAGETDVFEALATFLASERQLGRYELLDPQRVVLRGFSMGGAGAWHIGLARPDQWCVIGPGAGFTATHGFVKGLDQLPPYQEACLSIYDAVDYADNAFDVPVVAYAGSDDPQLQAAKNIEKRLGQLGLSSHMKLLVAPGLVHQFPPEWQKKVEADYAPFVAKGKPEYPPRVHFVTHTLKYPACYWVEILALDRHYARTVVDAEKTKDGFTVKTTNVRAFGLTMPLVLTRDPVIQVDGQTLTVRPWTMPDGSQQVYLQHKDGRWQSVLAQRLLVERGRRWQKAGGMTGPIDDAFTDGFVCVRGTDKGWHPATNKYVEADLLRFQKEWAKYFRGQLAVKDDVDVTNEDVANRNLILFGDPSSNALIAHVLDGLPLKWTPRQIELGGKTYASANHVPVLIYPNPLNPQRYVVLNSGHTFHEVDFKGTNALLYPRLGDFAVLRLTGAESDPLATAVATAGLFDEFWQVPKK